MRIGIDALGLPAFGGAKTSALGWLAALGRYDRDNQYLVFLSRPEGILSPFPNIEQRIIRIDNRFLVRIWAQTQLPRLLASEKVDLLHSVKNLGVFAAPCPTIITINDLTHIILHDIYPLFDNLYWKIVQPQILRRATRIIAISENTKHDLVRFYGLETDKIATIYPSCDDRFRQPCKSINLLQVRAKYNLPESFLLFVGGLGRHKNVSTLIQAFAKIVHKIPHGLVLVGGAHHTSSDHNLVQQTTALKIADRVWMLGSIPEEDLPALYHLADLFLFASLNEGFGLALLEAMACGTPILAARNSSVPEVIGNAGWLLDDPLNTEEFAKAIVAVLAQRDGLARMSARGLERSQLFTWEQTVNRTLSLYREVINEQT